MLDLIICTFNNASLLDRTLARLAEQQVPAEVPWAVCVVDNNSTDETPAVVAAHIRHGHIPGLRCVREPRQGLTPARVCGIRQTHSAWIAFVDDDCLLAPDWVANAARFAAAHPACGAFGGRVLLDWEVEPPPLLRQNAMSFAASDYGDVAHQLPPHGLTAHIPGAGLVLQRAALLASGWVQKQFLSDRQGKLLTSGGDLEIMVRIRRAGYQIWYTPDCVLHHIIPRRRISVDYLARLYGGFGLTAPYLTGMVHAGSYGSFLGLYGLRIGKSALRAARAALRDRAEGRIRWNYTRGQVAGLLNLIRQMDPADRRLWLGCGIDKGPAIRA